MARQETISARIHNGVNGQRGGWAWVWVAYSGFLFIEPVFTPTLHMWMQTLLIFAVFLLVYAGYVWGSDHQHPVRFWSIGAMFVLGMVCFPLNAGASTFFVYTASFLPFALESIPLVLGLFGVEAVLMLLDGRLIRHDWPNTIIGLFLTMIIGCGNIVFAQQKRADCRLRAAQEENVALAAVAERERIARDLHDVLGHTLSVITLKAELAARLLAREADGNETVARAAAEIADVERTARTALAEVREAIGGYRARGVAAELDHARRTLEAAGVRFVCDPLPAGRMSTGQETVLALALREAVTNIVRHARATECTVTFAQKRGQHSLVIADNGESLQGAALREGNGLRGMRERVEGIGGALRVHAGDGMRLEVTMPAAEAGA